PAPPAPAPGAPSFAASDRIPRRVPRPVLRPPLAACKPTRVALARVAIMPDRSGVARALADALGARGAEVTMLDPAATAEQLVASLSACGPCTGLYWLPALDDEGDHARLSLEAWREGLRVRVKLLYAAARALADAPFLVAATRMGGRHGYDAAGARAPMGGAVTGFVKAWQRERPQSLAKAVDFTPGHAPDQIARLLVGETERDPGAVELGHDGSERFNVGLFEETPDR